MNDSDQEASIPAGWYQSPGEHLLDRYWNGTAWTSRTRPRPPDGLQPASPHLIDHDDRRHPLPWVFTAVGLALLLAALFTRGTSASALLVAGGCLVLGVSGSLLQADLSARAFARVTIVLASAVLAVGIAAALSGTPAAWIAVGSAGVVLVTGIVGVVRAGGHRARIDG